MLATRDYGNPTWVAKRLVIPAIAVELLLHLLYAYLLPESVYYAVNAISVFSIMICPHVSMSEHLQRCISSDEMI